MKFLVVIGVIAALAVVHADDDHYDTRYDNFDVDELFANKKLFKGFVLCFQGKSACTPHGNTFKKRIPESIQTDCEKCNEKQKRLMAKFIKAIQEQLPEEWENLHKIYDPEGKYLDNLNKFRDNYS